MGFEYFNSYHHGLSSSPCSTLSFHQTEKNEVTSSHFSSFVATLATGVTSTNNYNTNIDYHNDASSSSNTNDCDGDLMKTLLPHNFVPTQKTVICGRGKACTRATGNVYLKRICKKYSKPYGDAKNKLEKSAIVSCILATIKQLNPNGGSFVKYENGSWYEVNDCIAREKIGGIFRDCLHSKYKSSTKSKVAKRKAQKYATTKTKNKNNSNNKVSTSPSIVKNVMKSKYNIHETKHSIKNHVNCKNEKNTNTNHQKYKTSIAANIFFQHPSLTSLISSPLPQRQQRILDGDDTNKSTISNVNSNMASSPSIQVGSNRTIYEIPSTSKHLDTVRGALDEACLLVTDIDSIGLDFRDDDTVRTTTTTFTSPTSTGIRRSNTNNNDNYNYSYNVNSKNTSSRIGLNVLDEACLLIADTELEELDLPDDISFMSELQQQRQLEGQDESVVVNDEDHLSHFL